MLSCVEAAVRHSMPIAHYARFVTAVFVLGTGEEPVALPWHKLFTQIPRDLSLQTDTICNGYLHKHECSMGHSCFVKSIRMQELLMEKRF